MRAHEMVQKSISVNCNFYASLYGTPIEKQINFAYAISTGMDRGDRIYEINKQLSDLYMSGLNKMIISHGTNSPRNLAKCGATKWQ